ncbi:hypothetical protein TNCV_830771 [Trichonephila clavipes]|nr:hypothetical protein TNCV_830771 [Trichonephila clavipes]
MVASRRFPVILLMTKCVPLHNLGVFKLRSRIPSEPIFLRRLRGGLPNIHRELKNITVSTQATFPFNYSYINIRAANQMPVHFLPSSNRKEPTQLLQVELFPTSTFNKPHLCPTSQRKPGCFTSSRTSTLPGAINFYNMLREPYAQRQTATSQFRFHQQ